MPAAEMAGFRAGLKPIQLPAFTAMAATANPERGRREMYSQAALGEGPSQLFQGHVMETSMQLALCVSVPSVSIMSQRVFGQEEARESAGASLC